MMEYLKWAATVPEHTNLTDAQVAETFWSRHPRRKFIKSLMPRHANLMDIGASQGGLAFFRSGEPDRQDINLYGVDFTVGAHADLYAGWWCGNLDENVPDFPGIAFDGFFASHLIEHLADPETLIASMARCAAPGASVYFEWPSPRTMSFPTSEEFQAVSGCIAAPLNFFDDHTHVRTYDIADVSQVLAAHGFHEVESGEIDLGDIAFEHIARGRKLGWDWFGPGIWAVTGWCSYIVARRG